MTVRTSPEGDEVGVAEHGAEEGQQEPPHLRVSLHVPPPDLGQQRLEDKRELGHFHSLKVKPCCFLPKPVLVNPCFVLIGK